MKDKLLLKVKHQVSDYESIKDIDSLIDLSIVEANEIIKNKDIGNVIKFDIAYFRFLLFVRQNEITEIEMKIYEKALELLKKAPYKELKNDDKQNQESQQYYFKTSTRKNF